MVLRKPLGAKLSEIDGMIRIAPHGNGAIFFHADKHSAADRAIAAGGRNPLVRDFLGGCVTVFGIAGVGIFVRKDVEANLALEALHAAASIPLAIYEAA